MNNNSKKRRRRLLPVVLVAIAILGVGGGIAVWDGGPEPAAQPEPVAMQPAPARVAQPEPAIVQPELATPAPTVEPTKPEPTKPVPARTDGCNLLLACAPENFPHGGFAWHVWHDGTHLYHDVYDPRGEQFTYLPGPSGAGWRVTVPAVPPGTVVVAVVPAPGDVEQVEFYPGPVIWWRENVRQVPVRQVEPPVCTDRARVSGGDVIRAVFVDAVYVPGAPGGTVDPGGGSPVSELI